jgi:hypothetical protein
MGVDVTATDNLYCEHPYRCGHLARHDWDDSHTCDELKADSAKGKGLEKYDCPACCATWEPLLDGSVEGYFKR